MDRTILWTWWKYYSYHFFDMVLCKEGLRIGGGPNFMRAILSDSHGEEGKWTLRGLVSHPETIRTNLISGWVQTFCLYWPCPEMRRVSKATISHLSLLLHITKLIVLRTLLSNIAEQMWWDQVTHCNSLTYKAVKSVHKNFFCPLRSLTVTGQYTFENGNVFQGTDFFVCLSHSAVSNESCVHLLSEIDIWLRFANWCLSKIKPNSFCLTHLTKLCNGNDLYIDIVVIFTGRFFFTL